MSRKTPFVEEDVFGVCVCWAEATNGKVRRRIRMTFRFILECVEDKINSFIACKYDKSNISVHCTPSAFLGLYNCSLKFFTFVKISKGHKITCFEKAISARSVVLFPSDRFSTDYIPGCELHKYLRFPG